MFKSEKLFLSMTMCYYTCKRTFGATRKPEFASSKTKVSLICAIVFYTQIGPGRTPEGRSSRIVDHMEIRLSSIVGVPVRQCAVAGDLDTDSVQKRHHSDLQQDMCLYFTLPENGIFLMGKKSTSRQRSGKGAIRKRLPLQKPRWEKTKLTIRYLYQENIS